jgi:hypothetical protein
VSRVGRWVPLLAVAALLGAAMIAAVFSNPTIERIPETRRSMSTLSPGVEPTEGAENPAATPTPQTNDTLPVPAWLTWLVTAVCATVLLIVVGSLLWLMLRERVLERRRGLMAENSAPPTLARTQARVRAALEEGLFDLANAEQDPRRAVIACWLRLEDAAAAAGTAREAGDTSTDLVRRLLAQHQISADVLDSLAALYREARFAPHAVDAAMREQAHAALRQVHDELLVGAR